MLDIASKLVALIVAAVGAITTIFNVFFKGERKRKEAYYDCLLKPFAIAYKKDPNINTVAFVQSEKTTVFPSMCFSFWMNRKRQKTRLPVSKKVTTPKSYPQTVID